MIGFSVWRWQESAGVWIEVGEYDRRKDAEAHADGISAHDDEYGVVTNKGRAPAPGKPVAVLEHPMYQGERE